VIYLSGMPRNTESRLRQITRIEKNMQIVIPMSGYGERFRRAGYVVPKPLIEVDGKAIIEHVVAMFPNETAFTFICNRDHLADPTFRMREIIEKCCPTGRIIGIAPHRLGPVNAVLQAAELICQNEPVIVNYCDFTCYWQYPEFKRFVEDSACDGAIPCYTGFHPHLLRSINFAYVKEVDRHVIDIQEKMPFTETPMNEFASSGTYYFRSGALLLQYLAKSMRPDLALNGEFYVSMAYKPMLEDGLVVSVFPIQHFMQWGTPEDLNEYRYFSKMFRMMMKPHNVSKQQGSVMVPMAGLGSRFTKDGYMQSKPLIQVSGKPMAIQAVADLIQADRYVFILRGDMPGLNEVSAVLQDEFEDPRLVVLSKISDGQASTCLSGMGEVDPDLPLTIGACDNGAIYDAHTFEALLADFSTDVVVWVARGYPGATARPSMYGWVEVDGDKVISISVKTPLANPSQDPIVTGTFTFKHASDFVLAVNRMIERDGRVNGEFYVDTCINDAIAIGLRVRMFEIDSYLCWGTPEDLKRFEYWQSCFHKWEGHPYRLEMDLDFPAAALSEVESRYAKATVAYQHKA